MTRFICCIGFLFSVSVACAQKVYFIYLESESQQPFFARVHDKTYNSSSSGFLILSNLRDTGYTITIGFPQDKWPEQRFSIPIRSKDRGYLLKNFGEKGWGLFDLQTMSIQMPVSTGKEGSRGMREGGVSAFTALLSKAANDPSLLEAPIAVVKRDEKPVAVQQVAKKEDVITQKELPATTTATAQTKKENVTVPKEQPASNTTAATQTKKEDVTAQKEQPASNTTAVAQTKKEDVTTEKGEPAANTTATAPLKKEDVTAQKEQPASNTTAAAQTKKEDVTTEKGEPASNTTATPQTKKEDVTAQKEQPASNTTATAPIKKEDVTTQKEQAAATTSAAQTKKVDAPIETAKATDAKTNTVKISEQQKKPDTGVAISAENAAKTTGTMAVVEQPAKTGVAATKDKEETKPAAPEKYQRSTVTKKSESSTTDGFGLVFIDQISNGEKDTISIFIPSPKEALVKKSDQPTQPRKFLDIGNEQKTVSHVNLSSNKACPSMATEKDFFTLRKKMAAQTSDDQMINESRKTFKAKCFTTEQIKNLGSLFLSEPGKFQFYEAAYPFSSDQGNFVALQSDFKDNYFIYRFKKLVN